MIPSAHDYASLSVNFDAVSTRALTNIPASDTTFGSVPLQDAEVSAFGERARLGRKITLHHFSTTSLHAELAQPRCVFFGEAAFSAPEFWHKKKKR